MGNNDIKSLSKSEMFKLGQFTLEQCYEAVELLQKRIKQLTCPDYQSRMDKEIEVLKLSTRAYNALMCCGLRTVGDIFNYGLENIEYIRNCGKLTQQEIKDAVLKGLPTNN